MESLASGLTSLLPKQLPAHVPGEQQGAQVLEGRAAQAGHLDATPGFNLVHTWLLWPFEFIVEQRKFLYVKNVF